MNYVFPLSVSDLQRGVRLRLRLLLALRGVRHRGAVAQHLGVAAALRQGTTREL